MILEGHGKYKMIGESPAMLKVYDGIERVADSNATVYIAGESGTGKELVARALHNSGRRSDRPFVPVNVIGIHDSLLEAELYGVNRRVATGVDKRDGLFIRADQGTLFLDEIAEMTERMQADLLRVLQESKVVPVGGNYSEPLSFDVRVIAASSRPLREYVKSGKFRTDLYHRLHVVSLSLPPLRDRGDDVCLLADKFLESYNEEEGKNVQFHSSVYPWLKSESWEESNVRELQNAVYGAVVWTEKEELKPKDFLKEKEKKEGNDGSKWIKIIDGKEESLHELTHKANLQIIKRAVIREGNISAAARSLKTDSRTIHRYFSEAGLSAKDFK
ncbi:sigma-54-dependent Fis family transcriptional regulator [Candidatus Woesearchaeota archaeon]|jgi:two-component system, NtrC family, response regulator HydG|nr:sigma-54-dependent Fis family transcriptional regulator [Candidatus Woesearchaeota archaeon]MBT5739897.1 sigma-54-dependent Fis family transcriptional regulator [Candidatus Woesearchaeota archaeon]